MKNFCYRCGSRSSFTMSVGAGEVRWVRLGVCEKCAKGLDKELAGR